MPSSKAQLVNNGEITGAEKLSRVSKLIEDLRADLEDIQLLPHERNAAIEQLKIFGRDAAYADPIFTPEGIEVFTKLSFHSTSASTSRTALQCLVNALLSKSETRQMFLNLGYSARAVARLKNPRGDDELLISRLLFLTSYDTSQDFGELMDNHGLAEYICDNISRHTKTKNFKSSQSVQDDQALTETLKLLFNIAYFYPSRRPLFFKAITAILKILCNRPIPSPPLQQPINHLINGLIYLDLDDRTAYSGLTALRLDIRKAIEKLLALLEVSLRVYRLSEMESYVMPLLTLLKRLASAGLSDVKPLLRKQLISRRASTSSPSRSASTFLRREKDKNSMTLAARINSLLDSAIPTSLHDAFCILLAEVSDGPVPTVANRYTAGRLALAQRSVSGTSSARSSMQAPRISGPIQVSSVVDASRNASGSDSSGRIGCGSDATYNEEESASEDLSARSDYRPFDSRSPSPVEEILRRGSSSASSVWSQEGGGDFTGVIGEEKLEGQASRHGERS